MAEKKIPGPVWIIVGAGIILMSIFIGLRSDQLEKFSLFILVGAVFIVIGFMKIMMREKKSSLQMHAENERRTAHPQHASHAQHPQHAGVHHTAQHPHNQQHAAHAQHPTQHQGSTRIVRCANCGVKLHPLFKFCPNCGQKM